METCREVGRTLGIQGVAAGQAPHPVGLVCQAAKAALKGKGSLVNRLITFDAVGSIVENMASLE